MSASFSSTSLVIAIIDALCPSLITPKSVTSLRHIAQALDFTAVRKIPAEPMGAAKIFQFHCRTNILHSVFTLKSRIQVTIITLRLPNPRNKSRIFSVRQARVKFVQRFLAKGSQQANKPTSQQANKP